MSIRLTAGRGTTVTAKYSLRASPARMRYWKDVFSGSVVWPNSPFPSSVISPMRSGPSSARTRNSTDRTLSALGPVTVAVISSCSPSALVALPGSTAMFSAWMLGRFR